MLRSLLVLSIIGATSLAATLDTSSLDEGQQRWLQELLTELPSVCGKPHSLETSLKSDPACKRSPVAARFLVKLLKLGLLKSEVEERFDERFVHPVRGECSLTAAPVRGDPKAPIAICEFSDYQCSHCKALEPVLTKLLDEYRGKVRLHFKNYPLEQIHPQAHEAAAAALAASRQDKFWPMHDLLFAHQESLTRAELEGFAKQLQLNLKQWHTDLPAAREQVTREHAEGEKLEISATPTLYINGRKLRGPHSYDNLKDWIDEELAK